jgi:predicted enzyme related to lactoylglutathione lyase
MTILTQHAPGTFCWPELGSTDQAGAKKFYSALFGWTAADVPMGPDAGFYTIFKKNGTDCAALFTLQPEMLKQGIPPYWGAYIAVSDADPTAKKAKELGGTVIMEPFDVMGTLGRMAVIQDPTGATVSVWQAKDHIGAGVLDENGALCWTELMTTDPARARGFYTGLIGWTTQDMPMEQGTYTLFQRPGGVNAAGMMKLPPQMQGAPSNWQSYFQVSDIQQTTAQVTQMGGKVMVPPTPIPNIGSFAVYADPQGAVFSVLQPAG